MIFSKTKLIRFSHCDPAGIVFYPRYVELINEIVEDWFDQGLKVNFHDLHEVHRLGIPAVNLQVNYSASSRYGDVLTFNLSIARIGNSSMVLDVAAFVADEKRFDAKLTVVMTSMDTMRPVTIDDTWRARLQPYLESK